MYVRFSLPARAVSGEARRAGLRPAYPEPDPEEVGVPRADFRDGGAPGRAGQVPPGGGRVP